MSADRFASEGYEDFLCKGKTAQECALIRERLAREEQREQDRIAEREAERAMAEDKFTP